MASYEQTPLQVFGNYPATRGEVEASLKANPNVDPSRPFSVRDPLVPLSDFCEIKGVNGEHQLHGITTAEHNYKLVPAVDYTAGYPQESGQERHNVFAMDPNPPLDLSNLPTKWGKVTGIKCVRDITHYLQGATNIVVIAGAGISTSLGIPDFRSEETGLYAQLQGEMAKYGLSDPQEIFDIELFRVDPSIFYAFANKLMPKVQGVSLTHKFLKALQEQGKLLTVYTQNVDDLELHAGVTNDKVIQVHGSVSQFICMKCGIQSSSSVYKTEAVKGEIPYCRPCSQAIQAPRRKARKQKKPAKRRRSGHDAYGSEEGDSEEGDDNIAQGVMKPNIVFFGEDLHIEYMTRLVQDGPKADLVIVMGTSLKVHPANDIISLLPDSALKFWINIEPPSVPQKFDAQLIGSCDVVIGGLAKAMGLSIEDRLFQQLEEQEVLIEEREKGVWSFTWIADGDEEE